MWRGYYSNRFIWLLSLAFLFGCTPSPEDTLQQYLKHTFLGNNGQKAYRYLSSEDKKFKNEDDFVKEVKRKNVFNEKILKKYKDQFSFEILETKYLNDDTALIKVILIRPNTENILNEMLTFAMASSLSSLSQENKQKMMQDQFRKIMRSEDLELESEEKEFILIREDGDYKVFLNYGAPFKMETLNRKMEKMEEEAEEQLRVIDYENALRTYQKILALDNSNYFAKNKLEALMEINKNTMKIGQSLNLGNITIIPEKVEIRKVRVQKKDWAAYGDKEIESAENYFILHFTVKNNSEGQVIEFDDQRRYFKEHTVYDNYGNEMKEYHLDFDIESVENYKPGKLIPGEVRQVKAVCEAPLSNKAEKFLWKIRLYTNNKKEEGFAYVRFSKLEIN